MYKYEDISPKRPYLLGMRDIGVVIFKYSLLNIEYCLRQKIKVPLYYL